MKRHLGDSAATEALASELLGVLPANTEGWTLLLEGELGAGKSTFARALIAAMGHVGAVPSPTYTLVEPYQLADRRIYHIDLYRISSEEELRYLGWGELEDGFRLVEWPERAPGLGRTADLRLRLTYAETGRNAQFKGLSERGQVIINKLETAKTSHPKD